MHGGSILAGGSICSLGYFLFQPVVHWYICTSGPLCTYVCMYVRTYVRMYVRIHVHTYVCRLCICNRQFTPEEGGERIGKGAG